MSSWGSSNDLPDVKNGLGMVDALGYRPLLLLVSAFKAVDRCG